MKVVAKIRRGEPSLTIKLVSWLVGYLIIRKINLLEYVLEIGADMLGRCSDFTQKNKAEDYV